MHERRRHFASTSGRVQRIWYMFAVGPPRSLIVPLKPGVGGDALDLARGPTRWLRLWIARPWCIVMLQNVQPPKQPRMIVTESRIIVVRGDRLARSAGAGAARTGRS